MKYKDKNTLVRSKKESKEINEYRFPLESNREIRRRRKKQLYEFWSKNLKGFLSEDFWNALDLHEQDSVTFEFLNFEVNKVDFIKSIKKKYKEKIQISREISLKKLGI